MIELSQEDKAEDELEWHRNVDINENFDLKELIPDMAFEVLFYPFFIYFIKYI